VAGTGLVLRILDRPESTGRFRIARGSSVVGRAADCAIAVDDQSLSRRHFKISWDGVECRVADLDSRNGLRLNGRRIREAVVHPGDDIVAVAVTFRLEQVSGRLADPAPEASVELIDPELPQPIFAAAAATLAATASPARSGTLLANLAAHITGAPSVGLYALIDGAQAFDLAFTGRLMGHELYTLFIGDLAEISARVGPCLVALGEPSAFLARWVERIGGHAGVLLTSSAALPELGQHLRRIFIATDETNQEYFFRFYDPRVLRVFLPTCREDELREFFGVVTRWVAEDEEATGFVSYSLEDHGLEVRQITGEAAGATTSAVPT
jgi:pSer/pThr/pTyr-binding forkhead associated (FHA) protein